MTAVEVREILLERGMKLLAQRQAWQTHIAFGNTRMYTSYVVFEIPGQGLQSYEIIWDARAWSTASATDGRKYICPTDGRLAR